jgi:prevent-host-death family protein
MTRIGVRELRQNASRYLSLVKAGETVEVTERGELVAILAPPSPAASARERLIAEGRLVPASAPFRLPDRIAPPSGSLSATEALDEQRAERL